MIKFTEEQDLRFTVAALRELAQTLDEKYEGMGPEGYCHDPKTLTPVESALRHAARCLADLLAHKQ